MDAFNIINLNASRCGNYAKIVEMCVFLSEYNPLVVCIQEINISAALRGFSGKFQVFCNIEGNAKDGVGIVSLV